jgi:organic hydroperoxide reductase OsmC/OhrA
MPARRLEVDATASFDSDKLAVWLEVTGEVPDIDQAGLEDAAQQAERACPVSNFLVATPQTTLASHCPDDLRQKRIDAPD